MKKWKVDFLSSLMVLCRPGNEENLEESLVVGPVSLCQLKESQSVRVSEGGSLLVRRRVILLTLTTLSPLLASKLQYWV